MEVITFKPIALLQYIYNVTVGFVANVLVSTQVRNKLFRITRKKYDYHVNESIPKERGKSGEYPPFSVAMSVYGKDNAEWLDMALNSIIEQTIKPNEIVLVVDGTVPKSIHDVIDKYSIICKADEWNCAKIQNKILKAGAEHHHSDALRKKAGEDTGINAVYDTKMENDGLSDKSFRQSERVVLKVIQLSENKGLGNALRIAIKNCSNELIARMDSDDIAVSNRFEQQIGIMVSNPEVDIVGGDIQEFVDIVDNCVGKRVVPVSDKDIKEYLKKRCPFNHMTVMYKKSAVMKAGGYKDLFWNEDYYLWIRMVESGCSMTNTGTVLVNVRVGEDMYKRRGGKKYFKSEKYLQDYMLQKKIIGVGTYICNIWKRMIVQVLMPNSLRGWVFKKFARN